MKSKMSDIRQKNKNSTKKIYKRIFSSQLILIISLALFLGISGTLINIYFEVQKRDQNLQNIAEAIAHSPLLDEKINRPDDEKTAANLTDYLDSLKSTLSSIDVISVVSRDNVRLYHSNHSLIGTEYDGTRPEFLKNKKDYYTANELGPSGSQRRAYAAVYDENGEYTGFVMAILLLESTKAETLQILLIFALITLAAIVIEVLISAELSGSIKKSLHGYEPNVFSAMYQVRDNILESLNEGILAMDGEGVVQFANRSAAKMLGKLSTEELIGLPLSAICNDSFLHSVLERGEKKFSLREKSLNNTDILIDCFPVKEQERQIGAAAILHDRAEYTKLMEDLTGTRYLVDSMRANNHDFTNKLHVILGLIQMEMYDEAVSYIESITLVQRETISKIMSAVDEPAVAALLIGKTARAAELDIKFLFQENSRFSKHDFPLPAELLVTVIGNLIDNAYDAMNINSGSPAAKKELRFGIFSRTGEVLLTVEDTGTGIPAAFMEKIFENGFSTKGNGRGTGLHYVKKLVEETGGKITVESQENIGTSFTVCFKKKEG